MLTKNVQKRLRPISKNLLNLTHRPVGSLRVPSLTFKHSVKLKAIVSFLTLTTFLFAHPGTNAQIPVDEVILSQPPSAVVTVTDAIGAEEAPTFSAPLQATYISTYFSKWHQGIDLVRPAGSPVQPVTDGEVVFAGWSNLGYGNLVTILHKDGFMSLYAHLAAINVKLGQKVTSETVIGLVGRTGVATGYHLHLELHLDGVAVNPLNYISPDKLRGI